MLPRALDLLQRVRGAPSVRRAELAGSVRRGCEEVADLDLVAASEQPASLLTALGELEGVRSVGPDRFELRLGPDGLRVDLRIVPPAAFAAATRMAGYAR